MVIATLKEAHGVEVAESKEGPVYFHSDLSRFVKMQRDDDNLCIP